MIQGKNFENFEGETVITITQKSPKRRENGDGVKIMSYGVEGKYNKKNNDNFKTENFSKKIYKGEKKIPEEEMKEMTEVIQIKNQMLLNEIQREKELKQELESLKMELREYKLISQK